MSIFKELFTDAKIEMDKRLKKEKVRDDVMRELGASYAKIAIGDIKEVNEFVDDQLNHFLWCMHKPTLKPPFLSVDEKALPWKEQYSNPYYMNGLKQALKQILELNIKEKIPKFCQCTVNIKENIKEYYSSQIAESWYEMKLNFEFKLDFKS